MGEWEILLELDHLPYSTTNTTSKKLFSLGTTISMMENTIFEEYDFFEAKWKMLLGMLVLGAKTLTWMGE